MASKRVIFTDKLHIEKWLAQHAPEALYNITENPDKKSPYPYLVDIRRSIDLRGKDITHFPFQFNTITGKFDCSYNRLESLAGAPNWVEGNFNCSHNVLTSLKGGPKTVHGSFWCEHNLLTSMEHSPKKVDGVFECAYNLLTTLKGVPQKIDAVFNCRGNQLNNLEHGPAFVKGNYYAEDNPLTHFYPFHTVLGQGLFITRDDNMPAIQGLESFTFDSTENFYLIDEEDRIVLQEKLMIRHELNSHEVSDTTLHLLQKKPIKI